MPVRRAEAMAVRRIIEHKWADHAQRDWLILGDLNDYVELNENPVPNGLEPLFVDGFSVNLVQNLPVQDRWTHFYPAEREFRQLDYLLASPSLVQKNQGVQPDIVRSGQPYRVPNTENLQRYPRVGFDRPKASDHCPVAVTLAV
jgi:predicted extracellular nuclease